LEILPLRHGVFRGSTNYFTGLAPRRAKTLTWSVMQMFRIVDIGAFAGTAGTGWDRFGSLRNAGIEIQIQRRDAARKHPRKISFRDFKNRSSNLKIILQIRVGDNL
jgi:hypothetical protein